MSEELPSELFPPPNVQAHGQLPPPDEFRFADQADPGWEDDFENFEPVESTPIDDRPVLTDEAAEEAEEAALESDEVVELLEDNRHEVIGTGLDVHAKGKDAEPTARYTVVIYDYHEDHVIEVTEGPEFDVDEVDTATYQPGGSQAELERAIEMAREREWLADRLDREHIGTAMVVTETESSDRLVDVRFRRPDHRLPDFFATVNLSTESVVDVGRVGRRPRPGPGQLDPETLRTLLGLRSSRFAEFDSITGDFPRGDHHE